MKDIRDIRRAGRDEPLNEIELKEYRKMTGKIAWLENSTRPDLSYTPLQLAKKNNSVTITNLRYLNTVLTKVRQKERRVFFSRLRKKEDLKIIEIGDAS